MTNADIEALLQELGELRRQLNKGENKQIFSEQDNVRIRGLATMYFNARQGIEGIEQLSASDDIFRSLMAMSRGNPSRAKVLAMLTDAKRLIVALEGVVMTAATEKSAGRRTATDQLIIDTLREVCPSAASAYSQAMTDLSADNRESWRGPAADMRESLRETLDSMAPDDEVKAVPNFKLEKDTHGPTMKQKVRYILKKREMAHGAMAAPEKAVEGIEDIVGGIMRSVYNRSSLSAHTATDRNEVLRVHAWVRLVFCDLLEIPPGSD
jgi:predicted pPIWI-associating nuclease